MEISQLDMIQQGLRVKRFIIAEKRDHSFSLKPSSHAARSAKSFVGRREGTWFVIERSAGARLSALKALQQQPDLLLAKYAATVPGGPILLRTEIPLSTDITHNQERLRVLLTAALSPDKPPAKSRAAAAEVRQTIRTALAGYHDFGEAASGIELDVALDRRRSRKVSIAVSEDRIQFAMPLTAGADGDLSSTEQAVIAAYILGVNAAHYFARIRFQDDRPIAEVQLPALGLTSHECRLALAAVRSFAIEERTLELLLRDARARKLYAAHHNLTMPNTDHPTRS